MTIGYERVGSGARGVIVLNDWFSDTSSWSAARPYLDEATFTWIFADLRGYGRSRQITGRYVLEEAAADVLALADSLDWQRFSIIGHSMSTLVALHLGQHAPARIERAVLLTPPPPTGFGPDPAPFNALTALALADDAGRWGMLQGMWGDRLSDQWTRFKMARWREVADSKAAAAYAAMFARDGLPDTSTRVRAPVLVVTGEQDMEPMRQAGATQSLAPLCESLTVAPIAISGHYPMQEAPPLLATIVQRFLK
jgi:pimeloyl-ACP methyl ester carboxylesterase